MEQKKFRLKVKSVTGPVLTYHIEEYTIKDGFLTFFDNKDSIIRIFPINNVELEEIR